MSNEEIRKMIDIVLNSIDDDRLLLAVYRFAEKLLFRGR